MRHVKCAVTLLLLSESSQSADWMGGQKQILKRADHKLSQPPWYCICSSTNAITPMTWPVPRKISLPEILKDLYKNEWDPGTSFLLFLSFSICDPQQSSVDGEQDKGKKAFVEESKGAISQSDSGCHFSAPVEDRTALQSSAPHQPMVGFVGTRSPKLNPAFLICTWMGWQVTRVCSCPCYVLSYLLQKLCNWFPPDIGILTGGSSYLWSSSEDCSNMGIRHFNGMLFSFLPTYFSLRYSLSDFTSFPLTAWQICLPCFAANVQFMKILFNPVAAEGRDGWLTQPCKTWDLRACPLF